MNTFVFGIDGASPDLVNRWINQGHLPNLKRIKSQGLSGKLKSTFPPLTGPAWSSFQTGVNPGKHGVFNWLDTSSSYDGKVINSNSIKTRTVWDFISSHGGRVGLLSLPVTYPPEKVNGFIVPGFLTPANCSDRSYPEGIVDDLEDSVPDFSYYVDEYLGGSEKDWVEYLKSAAGFRGEASRYLIKEHLYPKGTEREKNLFMAHFFATDLVQHFLWDRASEEWDPRLEVFKQVDKEIGKTMELAPDNSVFLIVSDHGFGPIDRVFNVNNWLKKEGFLKLKDSSKTLLKQGLSKLGINQHKLKPLGEKIYPVVKNLGLVSGSIINASSHPALKACFLSDRDVDWSRTVAYSKSDIGHIKLNLSGREQQGTVNRKEIHSIREELGEKLKQVRISSEKEKMAEWVRTKEEVYSGPYLKNAPDILFNPLKRNTLGFGAAMFLSEDIFNTPFKPGNHRRNGIFMAYGPEVISGKVDADIEDIAPTLLNIFSFPIPEQMDGSTIQGVAPREPDYHRPRNFYKSREANRELEDSRKKLENLGYL